MLLFRPGKSYFSSDNTIYRPRMHTPLLRRPRGVPASLMPDKLQHRRSHKLTAVIAKMPNIK
jgi:hypothetical protein